jgi:hypothetical protein
MLCTAAVRGTRVRTKLGEGEPEQRIDKVAGVSDGKTSHQ